MDGDGGAPNDDGGNTKDTKDKNRDGPEAKDGGSSKDLKNQKPDSKNVKGHLKQAGAIDLSADMFWRIARTRRCP